MPGSKKPELQSIGQALKAWRVSERLSQEDIAPMVRARLAGRKFTAGAVSQIERGAIRPQIEVMEAVAAVMGQAPDDFYEYRLAVARGQLDERLVGVDEALAMLTRFEAAQRAMARARSRRAGGPPPANPRPKPEDPPEPQSREAT